MPDKTLEARQKEIKKYLIDYDNMEKDYKDLVEFWDNSFKMTSSQKEELSTINENDYKDLAPSIVLFGLILVNLCLPINLPPRYANTSVPTAISINHNNNHLLDVNTVINALVTIPANNDIKVSLNASLIPYPLSYKNNEGIINNTIGINKEIGSNPVIKE